MFFFGLSNDLPPSFHYEGGAPLTNAGVGELGFYVITLSFFLLVAPQCHAV